MRLSSTYRRIILPRIRCASRNILCPQEGLSPHFSPEKRVRGLLQRESRVPGRARYRTPKPREATWPTPGSGRTSPGKKGGDPAAALARERGRFGSVRLYERYAIDSTRCRRGRTNGLEGEAAVPARGDDRVDPGRAVTALMQGAILFGDVGRDPVRHQRQARPATADQAVRTPRGEARNANSPKPAEKPEEQHGIVCPKYGCRHFRAVYTRHARGGKIVRNRECRHCGRRVITYEYVAF